MENLNKVVPSLKNNDIKFQSNVRQTRKNIKRELVALIEVLSVGDPEMQAKLLTLIELGTKLLAGPKSDKPASEMNEEELRGG